jgi:hypothetical protein
MNAPILRGALAAGGLSLLLAGSAAAVGGNSNGGAAGAAFRLGQGAALMGLGGAGVAVPLGPESRLLNPALTPWSSRRQLSVDWYNLSLGRSLGGIHATLPLQPIGALGVSWTRAAVDGVPEVTTWGEPTGRELEWGENQFSFGLGLRPSRFVSLGLNIGIYTAAATGLDEGASELKESTAAFDFGLCVHPGRALWLGLSLRNLVGSYAWDSSPIWGNSGEAQVDADLPTLLTLGSGVELWGERLLLLADYEASDLDAWQLRSGLELRSDPREMGRWALRGGFNHGGWALGMGFYWPFPSFEAGMDYAVTFHEHDPVEIHAFSWTFTF